MSFIMDCIYYFLIDLALLIDLCLCMQGGNQLRTNF